MEVEVSEIIGSVPRSEEQDDIVAVETAAEIEVGEEAPCMETAARFRRGHWDALVSEDDVKVRGERCPAEGFDGCGVVGPKVSDERGQRLDAVAAWRNVAQAAGRKAEHPGQVGRHFVVPD